LSAACSIGVTESRLPDIVDSNPLVVFGNDGDLPLGAIANGEGLAGVGGKRFCDSAEGPSEETPKEISWTDQPSYSLGSKT
jgi:hypothetical protein